MAAITWRELTGQNDAAAFQALSNATSTINSGFDTVGKAIAQRQVANQFGFDRDQDAQANAFKQALANARTPQEVEAIQATRGVALAGLDNARLAPTIGMEEARKNSIQTNTLANQDFTRKTTDDAQYERVQRYIALAATDPIAAAAYLAQNPDLRNVGDLAKTGVDFKNQQDKFASDILTATSNRKQIDANTLAIPINSAAVTSNAAAATSNALSAGISAQAQKLSSETGAAGLNVTLLDKVADNKAKAGIAIGAAEKSVYGNQETQNAVLDRVGKIVGPDYAAKATSIISKATSKNAEFRKLPADVVEGVAMSYINDVGHFVNIFKSNSSTIEQAIISELNAKLKDPSIIARMEQVEASRTQGLRHLKDTNAQFNLAEAQVFPQLAAEKLATKQAAETAASASQPKGMTDAQRGGGNTLALPTDTSNLPSPTQRFNYSAESTAGKAERRAFAEQEKKQGLNKLENDAKQVQEKDAKAFAQEILKTGSVNDLREFQTSPVFARLDKATQEDVFRSVNGVKKAK